MLAPINYKPPYKDSAQRYDDPLSDVVYIVRTRTSKDGGADADNDPLYVRIHGEDGSTATMELSEHASDLAWHYWKENIDPDTQTGIGDKFERGDDDVFLFHAQDEDIDDVGEALAIEIAIGTKQGSPSDVDGWKYDFIHVHRCVRGRIAQTGRFTRPAWMDEDYGQTHRFVWCDRLRDVEKTPGSLPVEVSKTWIILDNRGPHAQDQEGVSTSDVFDLSLENFQSRLRKTTNSVEVSISESGEFEGSKWTQSIKASRKLEKQTQKEEKSVARFTKSYDEKISVEAGKLKVVEVVYTASCQSESWSTQGTTVTNVVPFSLGTDRVFHNFGVGDPIPNDIAQVLQSAGVAQ